MGKKGFSTNDCRGCGEPFHKARKWQIFCKTSCRVAYWKREQKTISENYSGKLVKIESRLSAIEAQLKSEGRKG